MDQHIAEVGTRTYGAYLRRVVNARGFTEAEFVNLLYKNWPDAPKEGSRFSNLWNWYNDRSKPRDEMVQRMANILDVSPRSLNPKRFKPEWMDRPLLKAADDPEPEFSEVIEELPEDFAPQLEGESFGMFLKRLREARGLHAIELAERIIADPRWDGSGKADSVASSIGQWERDQYRPSASTLKIIASALRVGLGLLVRDILPDHNEDQVLSYGAYLRSLRITAGFATGMDFARALFPEIAEDIQKVRHRASTISGWELDRQKPRAEMIRKIANVLKVSARTVDPRFYRPRKFLPPTLLKVEPPASPKVEQVDVETVATPPEMLNNGMDIDSTDVRWGQNMPESDAQRLSNVRERFGNMPQFLKQHVDVFGITKTDDPAYVRVRFDAVVPRRTAGGLMRELIILTTDDLLGNGEE